MGFGLVLAGMILLFNPLINIVDLIPDAIGFFLISAGLTKTSFFVGKIGAAKNMFQKMAFLEIAKIFIFFLLPFNSVNPHELGSAQLLWTFVFGLFEIIMLVPAVNDLFEGLSFAGLAYNGTYMYDKRIKSRIIFEKGRGFVRTKKEAELLTLVKNKIISFYVIRNIITMIPELTELEMYEFLGTVTALNRPVTYYKPVLYILSFIAVTVLGIKFIVTVSKFFGGIKKDEVFITNLKEKYTRDILPKKTLFISINMKTVLLLFILSVITSFVIFIDGINIFVGAISSSFLIAASAVAAQYSKIFKAVIPISIARAAISIFNAIKEYDYFSEYEPQAVNHIEEAYQKYYVLAGFEIVEYILAAAAFIIFVVALLKLIKYHLSISGIQTETIQYSKKNKDAETYKMLSIKVLLTLIFGVINYIFASAYLYLVVYYEIIIFVNALVSIIWFVYSIYTVYMINEQIYNKEIDMA